LIESHEIQAHVVFCNWKKWYSFRKHYVLQPVIDHGLAPSITRKSPSQKSTQQHNMLADDLLEKGTNRVSYVMASSDKDKQGN
jgi:hypothetical protein